MELSSRQKQFLATAHLLTDAKGNVDYPAVAGRLQLTPDEADDIRATLISRGLMERNSRVTKLTAEGRELARLEL